MGAVIFFQILTLLLSKALAHDLNGTTLAFAGAGYYPDYLHLGDGTNKVKPAGLFIDIANILAEKYGFDYTFKPTSITSYLKDGKWTGSVGEVESGNADVGLNAIAFTYQKGKVVDFTIPILFQELVLIARQPRPLPQILNVMKPFSTFGWLLILGAVGIGLIAYGLVLILTPSKATPYKSNWMYVLYLFFEQGTPLRVRPLSTFIYTCAWLIFATMIWNAYSCNLRSYLISVDYEGPADTMRDIIEHDWNFYLSTAPQLQEFLAKSPNRECQDVYKRAKQRGNYLILSRERLTEQTAKLFRDDKMVVVHLRRALSAFIYRIERSLGPNTLRPGNALSYFAYSGIVLRKNLGLKHQFDKTLRAIIEGGIMTKLMSNYELAKERTENTSDDADIPLNMDHILLCLLVLSVGLIGSLVQFARELGLGSLMKAIRHVMKKAFNCVLEEALNKMSKVKARQSHGSMDPMKKVWRGGQE